ncbi:MAG TPA: uroporphyrinogen-III C-methyltransferase [Ignavibacteriaceae bacterium]|nr:uroporphyrinogen-III C-methyltransferase [Ignavibacteriaceae bacterium]
MKNIEQEIIPKLTLVGAGPGDPELITIKGINALASADVVLYDALVNTELLTHTKKEAKRIFVGKRAGSHVYSQNEINNMIVNYAFNFGHVVRLKGGDSFVFGRGHEELAYAELFNIKVEVIPGISSLYAVPELQHIPLTKRGINESFWVTTATTSNGKLSEDIYRAADTNAAIIILMGMQKLKEISEIFIRAGKPEVPAAIIQNGSLPDEKIGIGRVENLEELALQNELGSPAVIIIGEIVRLHPHAQAILKNNLKLNINY